MDIFHFYQNHAHHPFLLCTIPCNITRTPYVPYQLYIIPTIHHKKTPHHTYHTPYNTGPYLPYTIPTRHHTIQQHHAIHHAIPTIPAFRARPTHALRSGRSPPAVFIRCMASSVAPNTYYLQVRLICLNRNKIRANKKRELFRIRGH